MEATKVNCPKCGFEQEERLDCRKCGVVFSKYLAMQAEASGPPSGPVVQAENGTSVEILELRQSVRDLSRRFSEVEFERVERGQIRGELRVLDKKYQASFDQFSRRLEDMEKLLSNPQAPPPAPDGERLAEVQREILEANVDPIAKRLTEAEERLQLWATEVASFRDSMAGDMTRLSAASTGPLAVRLDEIDQRLQRWEKEQVPPKDSITTEILGRFEARLTDLETRVGSPAAASPALEPDAGYLELKARIQTLGDELAGLKSSTEKMGPLQKNLADLRAEIGKLWTQIQGLEGKVSRPLVPATEPPTNERLELDIRSIRDGMQEIREFITRIAAKA